MRIAIFNWRCFRHPQAGGSELYLYEQALIWSRKGHEITWYTSRPAGTASEEKHDGILFVRAGGSFSVYIRAAMKYFRNGKADVIIDVENGIPFFVPLYTRVPVILLIHHIHTDVWKREASWLTARIGNWLESHVMPLVYRKKALVTVSPSSAEMIENLFKKHRPIEIVYNAISSELSPGSKAASPEIIYLGRLRRYKSIDVLLRACSTIQDLAPVVHLVGQGEDSARLKRTVNSLDLPNVNFHGFVDFEEKKALLQRSWIAVNPSSMEGWGITNIEANASGVPVLGSDVPGIRDSISEGVSGFLFPYGDVNALAELLRELLVNQKKRDELAASARDWSKHFSWKASAEQFLAILYREIDSR